MYNEALGKWHFWLMFIGMNLTFGPMHWLGLQGMVRRTWVYAEDAGLGLWNMVSTVGSFVIAVSVLLFMINWSFSKRRGRPAPDDPWDARTLEWTIPSPSPEYNFAVEPVVTSLDDFWHRKYDEDEAGPRGAQGRGGPGRGRRHLHQTDIPTHEIHLPAPSYSPSSWGWASWSIAYGIIYHTRPWGIPLIAAGALVAVAAFVAVGVRTARGDTRRGARARRRRRRRPLPARRGGVRGSTDGRPRSRRDGRSRPTTRSPA